MSDILTIMNQRCFPLSSPLACIQFCFCSSYSSKRITEAFLYQNMNGVGKKREKSFYFWVLHPTSVTGSSRNADLYPHHMPKKKLCLLVQAKEEIEKQYLQNNKLDQLPQDDARRLEPPALQNGSIFITLETPPVSSKTMITPQFLSEVTKHKWSTQQYLLFLQHKTELQNFPVESFSGSYL